MKTFQIEIKGIVQGVGFRPFIFKLAKQNKFNGNICNTTAGVIIKINAENKEQIQKFILKIIKLKPEPAVIENVDIKEIKNVNYSDFKILKSRLLKEKFQLVSPDLATCNECIKDINNPDNKQRYNYAFTNCTNCGPRFTIIKKLPYDRHNTTMNSFKMCNDCFNEYNNPLDRRFHAQPNACRKCGPELLLIDKKGNIVDDKDPVKMAAKEIIKGKIIGIKSLGGFQIACDACSDETVKKLRERKNRPFKPFAIMIKNIKQIKNYYKINKFEKQLLLSSKAPVVLVKKKIKVSDFNSDNINLQKSYQTNINNLNNSDKHKIVSEFVSFNNKYEGVMLPYTPLHHLLFNEINFPLIMTSGNISEEPIVFENNEAIKRLGNICDYFLVHNRDIYSRFDDSVVKVFKKNEMVIRRARGYAPYPVKIYPRLKNETVLAIGSEEKNTFCIIKENYAIISQHIGDMDNEESIKFFKSTLNIYYSLFNIGKTSLVVSDLHPAFRLNNFAANEILSEKKIKVQHHKAHIASVIAENNIQDKVLGFAWDGTGYGEDGKIWGSEIFIVDENLNFTRIGHLTEKILPGGEITIRKPSRMAITYLYYAWNRNKSNNKFHNNNNSNNININKDINVNFDNNDFIKYLRSNFPWFKKIVSDEEIKAIMFQIKSKFNSIETTSMGRLFDAVSSILNLTQTSSFEGEAAINLEMIAENKTKKTYNNKFIQMEEKSEKEISFIIDDISLFTNVINDINKGVKISKISAIFHNTLSSIILEISKTIREKFTINNIALSGGVFQNNYLIEKTFKLLENNDFKVYTNFKVPVNDGGISLGQAYIGMNNIISLKEKN